MASSWSDAWGDSWGDAWGAGASPPITPGDWPSVESWVMGPRWEWSGSAWELGPKRAAVEPAPLNWPTTRSWTAKPRWAYTGTHWTIQ